MQEEKGMTQGKMAAWHHRLNGHELSKLPEMVKERQAGYATVRGVTKSRTWLSNRTTRRASLVSQLVQFSSVAQSCPTLWDPMDCSTLGLPVHHQLMEHTQTHVHWVSDAIQPSHALSSASPPTFNLSQHQGLLQCISSSHQVAEVLEFQLQHQPFWWTPRTGLL